MALLRNKRARMMLRTIRHGLRADWLPAVGAITAGWYIKPLKHSRNLHVRPDRGSPDGAGLSSSCAKQIICRDPAPRDHGKATG